MPAAAEHADMLGPLLLAALAGYLLGSLPTGYLVARSKGIDIFAAGSKSSGATNVRRVVGRGPGNLVFCLDVLKGAVAAGWPLFAGWGVLGYVGLGFALLGHSFSCFTRFRGGKGVATGAGGLVVLMPPVTLVAAAIWIAVFYASRFVSLASIAAATSLPIFAYVFHRGDVAVWVATAVAVFVILRHRANVGRLINGTEKRFERRKEAKP
jgi:acyl phosphate:glycerol-3-phosphate acyltransferase